MAEVTSWHFDFQLLDASGPIPMGDVDDVKVVSHVRTSTRKPRRAAPRTSYQGHDPFDITFKRGMYNGVLHTLFDACTEPATAPLVQAVATTTIPDTGAILQYLYTGIALKDHTLGSSADVTDEDVSFTADKRVRLS